MGEGMTQQSGESQTMERTFSNNSYSGNILIRSQYYGSMEAVGMDGQDLVSPMLRKPSRFRVEPCEDGKSSQLIARSPSLAQLENPEFQTRWYFKYFLGQVHCNYVFRDSNKDAYALSVCLTDLENHGIPQYRAILWRKGGCRRISFPYDPQKTWTAKEMLRFFMKDKLERNPREIASAEVQKELLVLEEQEGSVNFKFGVIYAKQGQVSDDEMFGNAEGSLEFENFLHVLGDTVCLQGWTGYRGGLDVKDNMTGSHSLYTVFEGHEVMFHVSVMLPYSKDSQQVERKRHIGNDIAVIVFVDGEPDEELSFKPSSIRTKFTHVFAVVRYSNKTKSYWISVLSEENVPVFGPPVPIPPRFVNPQEFRSFLITKLMNGEKAAYVSPVFSNKRQRTLESLINGLQNDKWTKTEKFPIKLGDQIHIDHRTNNTSEKTKVFVEFGQSLKVNKILQGNAPTSVANIGGLLAVKNIPWTPHPVLSNFSRMIACGDSYGDSLLVSTNFGIYHLTEHNTRLVFDHSMSSLQLNVVEEYGVFVVRLKKNGRIYVIPLAELDVERPFVVCRRHCAKYYLKRSKGCHVYTLSRPGSVPMCLAFAVSKRISLYSWNESSVWYASQTSLNAEEPPAGFQMQRNFVVSEAPQTITITNDVNKDLMLCLGLRHRFDVINVRTKEISVVKNIIMYRKPKIVSALDVFDDENPELLLTYSPLVNRQPSDTSVFVRLKERLPEIVSFYWNNAPSNIVCAFPYILGFSENSVEIRLMVNGNLVQTLCVPNVKLVTAKSDIFFTSSVVSTPTDNRKKKKRHLTSISQSFLKIALSDLAGLNFIEEPNTDEVFFRRNVGVYASCSSCKAPRKMINTTEARAYSLSVAKSTSSNDSSEQFLKTSSITASRSLDSMTHQRIVKAVSTPVTIIQKKNIVLKSPVERKTMSLQHNKSPAAVGDGTSFFYSPRKMSHSEELQRTANKIFEHTYISPHRKSLHEKSSNVHHDVRNSYDVTPTTFRPRVTTIV